MIDERISLTKRLKTFKVDLRKEYLERVDTEAEKHLVTMFVDIVYSGLDHIADEIFVFYDFIHKINSLEERMKRVNNWVVRIFWIILTAVIGNLFLLLPGVLK